MKYKDVNEVIRDSKCDRCGTTVGLYHPSSNADHWRCSSCIWEERKHLIELSKRIFDSAVYSSNINALANYIHEIERQEG